MKHSPYELKKSSSEKIQATQITIKVRGIARGKGKALKKEWNAKNTKKRSKTATINILKFTFFEWKNVSFIPKHGLAKPSLYHYNCVSFFGLQDS